MPVNPADELKDLLNYDGSRRIMDGDMDFILSVEKQVNSGRTISPKQADVISKIWDRYFGGR